MAAFSAISLAIGAATAGYSIYKGNKEKKEAEADLDSLEVPEIKNEFGDIPISTAGSDILREESQRTSANLIDASKSGGTRSVMSSIPKIVALNNQQNLRAAKDIDDQIIDRDYAIARGEVQNKRLRENRYLNDVTGLGQRMAVGEQNMWNGIMGMGTAVGVGLRGMDSIGNNGYAPVAHSANNYNTPIGSNDFGINTSIGALDTGRLRLSNI